MATAPLKNVHWLLQLMRSVVAIANDATYCLLKDGKTFEHLKTLPEIESIHVDAEHSCFLFHTKNQ